MTIVKKEPTVSKGYNIHAFETQSHRKNNWKDDEWVEVPESLIPTLCECKGYCNLTIENGVLAGITPAERPAPEPEPAMPTTEERLTALESAMLSMMGVNPSV